MKVTAFLEPFGSEMSVSTPCCGVRAGSQPSLSPLPSLFLLRCLEIFDVDEYKNVARVGLEDYHSLCLLIRYNVRMKSLGGSTCSF